VAGLVFAVLLAAAAVSAPILPLADPLAQSLQDRLSPPSPRHPMGTDGLGRDVLARTVWGARPTLLIVVAVLIMAAPAGTLIGAGAGFLGGGWDRALMRFCDVFMAFPRLVLAMAIAAVLGTSAATLVMAIALTAWTPYARVARTEAASLRSLDFLAASRGLGASGARLWWRHVAPLCLPSMVVRLALDAPGVILVISGLGFLGLGLAPPAPEWGSIVADGRAVILEAPWITTWPGVAIFLSGLSFNLLGDALRDALDQGER
jgi:peptide/nickel transport system permease protein